MNKTSATKNLRITLAQLNLWVGDIEGNAQKVIAAIIAARDTHHADLIVFPELALSGYPPEDLLLHPDLYTRIAAVFPAICEQAVGIDVVIGYPVRIETGCYNRASFIHQKKITHNYDKQNLPNYSVFDEQRYFKAGSPNACIVDVKGTKIALTICEDLWTPQPMAQAKAAGADLVLSLNASPFSTHKAALRQSTLKARAQETQLPIFYVNCIGGQDELIFDGGSMVMNSEATIVEQAVFFEETLLTVETAALQQTQFVPPPISEEEKIYKALVLGVRDYVRKNKFNRVILGLSGGIDSALTLAIAADAIGKDNIRAVMMPSRYSAEISLTDATQQAKSMGVSYEIIPIEPLFKTFLQTLAPVFEGLAPDITEENLQARCRGTLLMALANKTQAMVLTTSNKSETAVGYSTLYGDMAGGFCVLKDVFKTMVYRLAHYRNSLSQIIPIRVITRAPSAELAPDQKDQDTLPPYPILDEILIRHIEQNESAATIIEAGFAAETVRRVLKLIKQSEYKRRQAPPGARITERAFGKDWRYPITLQTVN